MRVRRNLLKTAPEQYAILCRVEELIRPADLIEFDPMPVAANDNNLGFGIERRHEVTPSNHEIEDLIQAYADGMRTRVIFHSSGSAERFQGGVAYTQSPDGEIMDVGGVSSCGTPFGLRFFRGAVMHYVKDGKRRKPDYRVGAQRGPDSRGWTPRETTSTPARPQALAELDRSTEAASFADAVGPAAMRQLRLVLEADSFAEIGRAYGYAASAAHRHGRRIAIAALKSAQEKIAA
ncbi:hypothetical protein EN873_24435 [bacterium M00.F.Ca.ET.230.01.1.1]|nr:hypothetical protein EN873_24435 [bacterium M00.F.Ca.ET.230.01.1.1]